VTDAAPAVTSGAAAGVGTATQEPAPPAHPQAGTDPDAAPAHAVRPPALPAPRTGARTISWTFDDGPDPVYTPQILAVLARWNVHATFCMVGQEVAARPDVVRAIAAAGHRLCNHSWNHSPQIRRLTRGQVRDRQLVPTTQAIVAATGQTPEYFRAPYGYWTDADVAEARDEGLTPLAWNVDPRDWSRPGTAAIVANVLHNVAAGSVILLHDGGGNRAQSVAALSTLLPRLAALGYRWA
jgi:peptidoglycan/xylan/chitin deacetylase (PgdA/CDA1 family)